MKYALIYLGLQCIPLFFMYYFPSTNHKRTPSKTIALMSLMILLCWGAGGAYLWYLMKYGH